MITAEQWDTHWWRIYQEARATEGVDTSCEIADDEGDPAMTGIMINPGSGPVESSGEGWTNTREEAQQNAIGWLKRMHHDDGMRDVELLDGCAEREGRWVFTFRHTVTGVEIELETHGIDHMDAYMQGRIFHPRVYWNGSSSSSPELDQFAAKGFEPVRTFRAVDAS